MTSQPIVWSYSGLKTFQTCARKYHHEKVLKDVPYEESEAALYGVEAHKAAEEFIRDGVDIPEKFAYLKQYLLSLNNIPGVKLCEHKMGLTKNLEPCDFFDKAVWFRGVADLLIINEEKGKARIVDYKFGKSSKYADTGQLELMALAVFKHFPKVRTIKAGLLFAVANNFIADDYQADKQGKLWNKWLPEVRRLETAYTTGVWNPKQNNLCREWCGVLSCPHNGRT